MAAGTPNMPLPISDSPGSTIGEVAAGVRRGVGIPKDLGMDTSLSQAPYGGGGRPIRPLDRGEVKGILQRELEDALGGLGSQISEQQRMAIRMYYGRPIGNEQKDRSQVVLMDVLETIEWAMPSLMKMFTGGQYIARFKPRKSEDIENAELATEYINHAFMNEQDGFQILYDWFKTALLEKNGIVKVYWEERVEPKVDTYKGLTEDEMMLMLQEPGIDPISIVERDEKILDESSGLQIPVTVYDLEIRVMRTIKRIRTDGVPPEEFLIARRTIVLDDHTTFSAHRKKQTVSDLVAMGFPFEIVSSIPSDDTPEYTQGRTERLSEDETYPITTAERIDPASRDIWTTECYARIDEDGDGYTELRRILIVGEQSVTILDDTEVNSNPFVSITPVPMPHKFYGQSLADLVIDLQVIRSTILRQILDNIYLSNNPRLAVTEGMVEIDDLLTVRPGGLVRQSAPGNIEPIVLPSLPPEAYKSLEYLQEVRNNRTGVMAHGAELDASAINTTATGMSAVMAEKQSKIELMARIFASGVKKLFRKHLQLMVENDTKEREVQLSGKWVTINPASWDADMDVEVEVGMGAGQAPERLGNLDRILTLQEKLLQSGVFSHLVEPENVFNAAREVAQVVGYKDPGRFFSDPRGKQPPTPPPDPDLKKVELEALKAQSESQLSAGKMQFEIVKQQNLQTYRMMELAMKERVEMARIEANERAALGGQEASIESSQIAADATKQSATISAKSKYNGDVEEEESSETEETE